MKRPLARRAALALAALALAAAGGTALADEPSAFRPPLLAPAAPPADTAPALQAAIDPDTGLLRPPTVSERIELAALAREAAGLRRAAAFTQTEHADGTVSAPVDPALHSLSTVTVTADGRLHYACGDAGHSHQHPVVVTAPAAEER